MGKIRVLVVDDSLTVRKHLVEVLANDPDLEVVGEAADGAQAIAMCERLRPDVMTLDLVLPETDGVSVTGHLMAHCPTPILIVSSASNRGERFDMCEALSAGAVDVLEKPHGQVWNAEWEKRLRAAVKLVSRIKVISRPRSRRPAALASEFVPPVASPEGGYQALALGASTGGPGALLQILRALPASFELPILLVIHIGESFGQSFVEWLDKQLSIPVRSAVNGERFPAPGAAQVVVAPAGQHLVIRQGRLWLTQEPERHSCRPSVDVLFESVAQELGERAIACLLTGMGRDGATGLLAIRRAGGMTIAQDEATSVVFGMPREAQQLGAARQVLPLEEIAPALVALAHGGDAARRVP